MNAQRPDSTTPAAPLLRLHLLGGFRATRDSGPALADRWPRPGARALVKLLAVVPGHRLHREEAIAVCWPDADPKAAAGSLRVALHAARRALEPELAPRATSSYLVSDGALLHLDPATVWIDADEAEASARTALADGGVDELSAALDRFTGELLPEDRYARWADDRRGRLLLLREKVLLRLAGQHLDRGATAEAAAVAEQVLTGSPAEELAHRILIDAWLRQGLRRRAVHQYHVCREALDTELGVRPGPETERLHRAALAAAPAPSPATPLLPAPLRAGNAAPPLRGRDAVLERLLAAGGPPVTLLTGEAGVGKTRLVGEVARRAAAAGTAVLWGGGQDAGGQTPYGAFAEALDGWLVEHSAAERARVGAEYPELAAFLPSLGQVGTTGERSPEEERDRLFRAGTALLGDLAAARPVLVVLDDLHDADTGSYQLLGYLARRAVQRGTELRFLATYREEELPEADARRSAVASLLRQRLAVREELGRLDRESCLAVVRDAVAADAGSTEDSSHRVWELSLGNPLFALELARGLPHGQAGDLAPDGVRELVTDRLVRLDADARRMVEALSAAGGDAALTELLDVAGHGLRPPVTGAAAADALERAIAASLIEERQVVVAGRSEAGVAFRHPLVRLTCYEQLTTVRRRQLHAAFAQTVQRRRPDAVDTLASHFARADDPRAAEYLRRAAERAAALYANDTADRYYRDLVERLDVDAARARLAHAHVLRRMGHFEQAADAIRLALAEFVRRGDHDDAVLAAALLAETLVKTSAPDAARRTLREHPVTPDTGPEPAAGHHLALSVVRCVQGRYTSGADAARHALAAARNVPGTTGQGLAARAFALQAANLGLAGRLDQAREAGDQALAPAEAYGDPTLLGSVLSTLRENARRAGRLREAVEIGSRALGLAEQSGDPTAAAFERANLAELRLLLEEPEPARALAAAAVSGAEAYEAWCLPYALATMARVRVFAGDTDEAAALLDRAEAAATALGDRQAGHEVRTARAELALHTHRPDEVLHVLDGHTDDAPVLVAWAELLSGHPEAALRLARAEVARAERTGERLAEVEARTALGASLSRLGRTPEGAGELTRAESLAASLPYPAGTRRAAWARGLPQEA
ncbi:AAA family ATPase [Streptomyces sp. NBC_00102]|uniref:ATP-binding protein n=1 Tax=Streptomyces sp. NBC_00102 TaxID=2975652 RepID=UPI0022513C3D|nr:AAA family ATPase [Streptomyces sp. NBC_00102]MCX5400710.1 AAA family ATPase [Streptomyces sp. NBC_00102]